MTCFDHYTMCRNVKVEIHPWDAFELLMLLFSGSSNELQTLSRVFSFSSQNFSFNKLAHVFCHEFWERDLVVDSLPYHGLVLWRTSSYFPRTVRRTFLGKDWLSYSGRHLDVEVWPVLRAVWGWSLRVYCVLIFICFRHYVSITLLSRDLVFDTLKSGAWHLDFVSKV